MYIMHALYYILYIYVCVCIYIYYMCVYTHTHKQEIHTNTCKPILKYYLTYYIEIMKDPVEESDFQLLLELLALLG